MKLIIVLLVLFPLIALANKSDSSGVFTTIGEFFLKLDNNSCLKDKTPVKPITDKTSVKHDDEHCKSLCEQKDASPDIVRLIQEREYEFNQYLNQILKNEIKVFNIHQSDEMISSVSIASCELSAIDIKKSSLYLLTPKNVLPLKYEGDFETEMQTSQESVKINLSEFSYKQDKLGEYFLAVNQNPTTVEVINDQDFKPADLSINEINEINRKNLILTTKENPLLMGSGTYKDCHSSKLDIFTKISCPGKTTLLLKNKILTVSYLDTGLPILKLIARVTFGNQDYYLTQVEIIHEKEFQLIPEFGYRISTQQCTPPQGC